MKFKTGQKIHVRNDVEWYERIFLFEYEGLFFTLSLKNAEGWRNILKSVTIFDVISWKEAREIPFMPKKGDLVEVSDCGVTWDKEIFLTEIKGSKTPIICVHPRDKSLFLEGKEYGIIEWTYMRQIK